MNEAIKQSKGYVADWMTRVRETESYETDRMREMLDAISDPVYRAHYDGFLAGFAFYAEFCDHKHKPEEVN